MQVDEARRHRSAPGVDRPCRDSVDLPDRRDLAASNGINPRRGAPPPPSTICALVMSNSYDGATAFGGVVWQAAAQIAAAATNRPRRHGGTETHFLVRLPLSGTGVYK